MSFQTIGTQIQTAMNTLVSGGLLGTVYNYDVKLDGTMSTPCVIISPADGNEEVLDTAYNETEIPYYVRVIDQVTDDKSAVENNMRALADSVLEKLKDMSYFTYSNGAIKRIGYDFRRGYNEGQELYRVFEVLVTFYCVETK